MQKLNKHFSLITLLIVFIATTAYFGLKYQKEKTAKEFQVSVHKFFLARLEPNNDVISTNADDYLPVLLYTPESSFSKTEKSEIVNKVFIPFVSWEKDNGKKVEAMNIRRNPDTTSEEKYIVNYIENDGSSGAFIYGKKNPLEWWAPLCDGDCNFSPEYKAKFPEVVSQGE